ncbi:hypothetical protein [Amycolatopsis sp. cmx-4-83]|uniref:hypothetical protein n=1 Tax=Amycolatopsis sp. cmx-4-83 TaxID=2790940 RepID=UPI00397D5F77
MDEEKNALPRAVLYTLSGGFVTMAFGLLGAGAAQAMPLAGDPPAGLGTLKAAAPPKPAAPANSASKQRAAASERKQNVDPAGNKVTANTDREWKQVAAQGREAEERGKRQRAAASERKQNVDPAGNKVTANTDREWKQVAAQGRADQEREAEERGKRQRAAASERKQNVDPAGNKVTANTDREWKQVAKQSERDLAAAQVRAEGDGGKQAAQRRKVNTDAYGNPVRGTEEQVWLAQQDNDRVTRAAEAAAAPRYGRGNDPLVMDLHGRQRASARKMLDTDLRGVNPPKTFKATIQGGAASKGGGFSSTDSYTVDDWTRVVDRNGTGTSLGVDQNGNIVAVTNGELSPELRKKISDSWSVSEGTAANHQNVTVFRPKGTLQGSIEDLAKQYADVSRNGDFHPGELPDAIAGTGAVVVDGTIGLGQGTLYKSGKQCFETGQCGDAAVEGLADAAAVLPVGKAVGAVGRGVADLGRAATPVVRQVVPEAVRNLSWTTRARIADAPVVSRVLGAPAAARAAVSRLPDKLAKAAEKLPEGSAKGKALTAAGAVPRVVTAVGQGFDAAMKVPNVRYAVYHHTAGNAVDEAGRVGDCVRGQGCGPAVAGAGLLAFDAVRGRGVTDLYEHGPGCAEGHGDDCAGAALDALPAGRAGRRVLRANEDARRFLDDPQVVKVLDAHAASGETARKTVAFIRRELPRQPQVARMLRGDLGDPVVPGGRVDVTARSMRENPDTLASFLKTPKATTILRSAARASRSPGEPRDLGEPMRVEPTAAQKELSAEAARRGKAGERAGLNRQRPYRGETDDRAYAEKYYNGQQKAAARATGELRDFGERLAGELGGTFKGRPGPKKFQRFYDKVREYDGDGAKVVDLAAGTVFVDRIEDAYAALPRILAHDGFQVVRFKDRIAKPQESGYRDLLLNVRMPDGHVAELKVQLNDVERISAWEHPMYEIRRDLETRADAEGAAGRPRPYTADERALIENALLRSRSLYDPATRRGLG